MPYCITCGSRFKGRGSVCLRHSSYDYNNNWQPLYNYSSDSTDPSSIRYRMNHRRRTRTFQVANGYDNYGQHNDSNAIVRYDRDAVNNAEIALVQPLVQTFTTLSHAHAISSLTYSITASGTQSLTAEANFDREQCSVCRKWFPDHQKLDEHRYEFPVGCEVHGLCMRMEDVQCHGTSDRHDRCFVRGCGSVYRREGGWKGGVVEGHVRSWHC